MKQWIERALVVFKSNYRERTMLMSTGSLLIGVLIGVVKLLIGLIYSTPWFTVTAVYYLMLCLAKGRVLQKYYSTRKIKDPFKRFDQQFDVYKHDGVFICLVGISYLFVCLRMYFLGESSTYPFYLIYGVATVAFYKAGSSIRGIIVTKKMKNPLLSALQIIAIVDACVSIVAVQCALLTMQEATLMATTSSALLGMALSIVFIGIGIYMLRKKKVYPPADELDIADIVKKEKVHHESFARRALRPQKETHIIRSRRRTQRSIR